MQQDIKQLGYCLAFTLTELLIVLVLMGVLAGSLVVSLAGREEPQVMRLTVEDLMSALKYTMNQARSTQRDHRLVFDVELHHYVVEQLSLDGETWEAVQGMAGQGHALMQGIQLVSPEDGQAIEMVSDELLAYSFGPNVDDFTGTIRLMNTGGQMWDIQILPISRQIQVIEDVVIK
ncbi:MAG: hypothetical protein CMJ19_01095 [Phycisphaeraceae bacterium]|nr:hypothetical protein [Phycisphaeraceae bacterium]